MLGACELWILHSFNWLQNINRHTTSTRVCQAITWAGLSLWFHSSKPVCSKISQISFAVIFGCIVVKLSCRKTVVTSVHLKTLSSFIVRAQKKSFFNWAANGAACFPCLGIVFTFTGRYVIDTPEIVTQSQKTQGHWKLLRTIAKNIYFQVFKISRTVHPQYSDRSRFDYYYNQF